MGAVRYSNQAITGTTGRLSADYGTGLGFLGRQGCFGALRSPSTFGRRVKSCQSGGIYRTTRCRKCKMGRGSRQIDKGRADNVVRLCYLFPPSNSQLLYCCNNIIYTRPNETPHTRYARTGYYVTPPGSLPGGACRGESMEKSMLGFTILIGISKTNV